MDAVGEPEFGFLEPVLEAEGVEVFPVLRGGYGDASLVRGVGDSAGVGESVEVCVLLDPVLAIVVGEPVETYVEVSLEFVSLLG